MFGNPPMNSNGMFGKTGNNPNTMNPNVSGFNSGNSQQRNAFSFGAMGKPTNGVMVGGGGVGGSNLFSGQNNSR